MDHPGGCNLITHILKSRKAFTVVVLLVFKMAEGKMTTVSQLASWAMGARPEVVLPTHHSGERRESGLAGGLLGRFRGEGSSPLSLWARVLVTT